MSKPQDLTRSTSDSGAEAEHPRVVVAEDEALIRLDLAVSYTHLTLPTM